MTYESPAELRAACREGWAAPTSGHATGFTQCNLVVLPKDWAFDFLLFCPAQPEALPGARRHRAGQLRRRRSPPAPTCARDLPRYRVWRDGELVEETADATRGLGRAPRPGRLPDRLLLHLRDAAAAGRASPSGHIEQDRNVPMYRTNRPCRPAGRFTGPLVVSMRPIPADRVADAVTISGALSGGARRAGAFRRPGRARHRRPGPAGLRRPGGDPPGRGPGLLGLRRDPAGGGDGLEAAVRDHPHAGAHVRHATCPIGSGRRDDAFPARRPAHAPRGTARSRGYSRALRRAGCRSGSRHCRGDPGRTHAAGARGTRLRCRRPTRGGDRGRAPTRRPGARMQRRRSNSR